MGIDVVLQHFATFSNGQQIDNSRFLKKEGKSKERKKQGKVVAKVHEKIRNQRKDFCHKES